MLVTNDCLLLLLDVKHLYVVLYKAVSNMCENFHANCIIKMHSDRDLDELYYMLLVYLYAHNSQPEAALLLSQYLVKPFLSPFKKQVFWRVEREIKMILKKVVHSFFYLCLRKWCDISFLVVGGCLILMLLLVYQRLTHQVHYVVNVVKSS